VVDRHGAQSRVLHTVLSPAARVESAQTRKARSSNREVPRRLDLPGKPDPAERSSDVKRETIDLCHWGGHPTSPLCWSGARFTWCGNEDRTSSTECGCVAVCPIGDIVPVVTAKTGSRAFLLSRIGHPAYIRTSALRVLSNARAP